MLPKPSMLPISVKVVLTKSHASSYGVNLLTMGFRVDTAVNAPCSSMASEAHSCLICLSDGQYIAIGCRDNMIYLYNVLERGTKYTNLGKCSGHSSFVLHIDWSEDSQYLRSTSGDYELLFWSPTNCKQVSRCCYVKYCCDI